MSVVRVNKTTDYVIMSKEHFKEKDMSLKAKGLLSEMLSLPDNWDYSISGLVSINKENETAIKTTLEELKCFGYLKITKLLPNETKTGRIEYIYDVYEKKQKGEKQGVENLGVEFQWVENQGQYNNNKLNNINNINNNIYKKIIDYLNNKIGSNYRSNNKTTIKHIKARLNEGFKEEDFKKVIDKMYIEWYETDMQKYLRPETLFGTKFESYLNREIKQDKLPEWFDKEIPKNTNNIGELDDLLKEFE